MFIKLTRYLPEMKPGSSKAITTQVIVNFENILWMAEFEEELARSTGVAFNKEEEMFYIKMLDDQTIVTKASEVEKALNDLERGNE